MKKGNAIILVHGFTDTAKTMRPLAKKLRAKGREVHVIDLVPNTADYGLEELAHQLQQFIEVMKGDDAKVDIIGFSMGGIVSRYYIQKLGGHAHVRRFVTISSPHHGTYTGYLSAKLGPKQMRYNSAFIRQLNSDVEVYRSIKLLSIWMPLDIMILPAQSSIVSFGHNVKVWEWLHPWMVSNKACFEAVWGWIEGIDE